MSLTRIDIKNSHWIPLLLMGLVSTYIFIDLFAVEQFSLSYISLVGMLGATMVAGYLLIRYQTLTRYNLIVLLYLLLVGGVSLMNGTNWKDWTYHSLSVLSTLILFHYYRDQYQTLVIGALMVLSVGVYLQLAQCLLHPEMWLIRDDKMNSGYLLGGNYNQIGCRVLFAFALGIISVQYSKWWYLNLIPLVIAGLTIQGMVLSMTSFSCIMLFLLFCLIRHRKLMRWGLIGLYCGWILFQCVVCFSGTGLANNETISWFVEDVLGKDMTFTGRTDMWDAALHVITRSPIWGYGYADRDWYLSNMSTRAIGAHNYILNNLIYGGAIALLLYVIMIYLSIRHLWHQRDRYSLILIAAFGCLSTMMLFETYSVTIVIIMLSMMYYYQPVTTAS